MINIAIFMNYEGKEESFLYFQWSLREQLTHIQQLGCCVLIYLFCLYTQRFG